MSKPRLVVVGGGAAGFFGAICCAEANPNVEIIILERGREVLQKVKVSGGGRCNVTHACFIPKDLVKFYPRGSKALLGPFHKFGAGDTMAWFDKKGVKTKIEEDDRVFPESDSSQTIIDCFIDNIRALGIQVRTQQRVEFIHTPDEQHPRYCITLAGGEQLLADAVLVATGSSAHVWDMLRQIGHTIVKPVPSLFTFNIQDERLKGLAGVSVPNAHVQLKNDRKLAADGALLITHWGLSAYSVLRLSAWGARALHDLNYQFELEVNWTGYYSQAEIIDFLTEFKQENPKKQIQKYAQYGIPSRLWERLVMAAQIPTGLIWADISKKQMQALAQQLAQATFTVKSKSTFKDEFVTAGGVELDEVDFTTFQSKKHKGLFLAGEVLDIDAITGGFNFQAAWTGGFVAGNAIAAMFGNEN